VGGVNVQVLFTIVNWTTSELQAIDKATRREITR